MAPGNNWVIDANHVLDCSNIISIEKRHNAANTAFYIVLVTKTSTAGAGPSLSFDDAASRDAFFTLIQGKIV